MFCDYKTPCGQQSVLSKVTEKFSKIPEVFLCGKGCLQNVCGNAKELEKTK
jgi:hypothetical protein